MKHDMEMKSVNEDTKCGIGCFSPRWLQFFASKKAFVVIYALAGMETYMISSYYVGILSTTEKNFHMSSRMSGIISAAWDIGGVVGNLILSYIASKSNRARWIAFGIFVVSLSSFTRTIPYHLYNGGETSKLYTKEYETVSNITKHSENYPENSTGGIVYLHTNVDCALEHTSSSDMIAFYTFVISQLLSGVGASVYFTCGIVYLDDNVRKNIVPVLLGFSQALRLFGPTIGFLLSSYTLKIYVNPYLTPIITNEDPRWIGAWWIGWYPMGIFGLMTAFALMLFPKILPRAALRKATIEASSTSTPKKEKLSLSDFMKTFKRVCKNKIVVFNSFSSVTFTLGVMAFWTFMPKYLESQFRLTPSQSSFLSGTVVILSNALGILAAGFVISKFKPRPRFLAGWNVFVEFLDVLGRLGYMLLSCPDQTYHGHLNRDNTWNLNETCNEHLNCGTDIQYAPVCDVSRNLVFFSTCHAGCTTLPSMINNTLIYKNCSCIADVDTMVSNGMCPVDCSMRITLLIVMMAILGFTSATGRSANTIIQFRCVEEKDKAVSIGITETLLALLAKTPVPILYGIIMDWACIVWGDNCGSKGNCWIYDNKKLRYGFNLVSAAFLLVGTILDCFVWYYVKGVKIYDEDFLADPNEKKTANQALTEKFIRNEIFEEEQDNVISLMSAKYSTSD